MADQMPRSRGRRGGPPAVGVWLDGAAPGALGDVQAGAPCRGPGPRTRRSSRGGAEASTISTGRSPPRNRAASSRGSHGRRRDRSAAGPGRQRLARRSRDRARCAPRLVGARAWTSSTMIVCDAGQVRGGLGAEQQEQRLRRGDQDLRGLAELALALPLGRVAGADRDPRPVRRRRPTLSAARAMPARGARRLRSMS